MLRLVWLGGKVREREDEYDGQDQAARNIICQFGSRLQRKFIETGRILDKNSKWQCGDLQLD